MDDQKPNPDWRYRLKGDPARWLLEQSDNPSVYFWFQRDIVGRPEDAPALVEAREDILYSPPVQALFAAQDPLGYWEQPDSLDEPRYRATAWSLALLAELGVPRTSRRAHAACEFILQCISEDATVMRRLDRSAAGLLGRALVYFKQNDPRLLPVLDGLAEDAAQGHVFALLALAESGTVARHDAAIQDGIERVLDALANSRIAVVNAFPPFDEGDALVALRVLTALASADDQRTASTIEMLWDRQRDGARWALGRSFESVLGPEPTGIPDKWATLNALRVLTKRSRTTT